MSTTDTLVERSPTDTPVRQVLVGAFWAAVAPANAPIRCGLASGNAWGCSTLISPAPSQGPQSQSTAADGPSGHHPSRDAVGYQPDVHQLDRRRDAFRLRLVTEGR